MKHLVTRTSRGENTLWREDGRNVFRAKRPGGKMILAEEKIWGETTRTLDSKIVTQVQANA